MAKRFGVMLDMSRNAVMKPEQVKKYADTIKKLGYNMILLYTEDTYEVDGEPYFGYLRGRYSKAELKDMVNYCDSIGVELIPCIQTLAHLNQIFYWQPYQQICDFGDILLVEEDRTYQLIDNMFKSLRECYTSDIIHIGMDEAHMLGLGRYRDKHGEKNRFEILHKHLEKVIEIAKKYNFKPIMWSDMFFRLANNGTYFLEAPSPVTENLAVNCPDGVEQVYWDYYSNRKGRYDTMLDAHAQFKGELWFGGGAWTWNGFGAGNALTIENMTPAMNSCKERNIDNIFMTMWGDNGKECSFWSLLPSLFAVRRIYDGVTDMDVIKKEFKERIGEDYDNMMLLDLPIDKGDGKIIDNSACKYYLYNDAFLGFLDPTLIKDYKEDYLELEQKLLEAAKTSSFAYIFESHAALAHTLAFKNSLGVKTRKAYKEGDKEALSALVGEFDSALDALGKFVKNFRKLWYTDNKPHGFDIQDIRLGGLTMRLTSERDRLKAYITGETENIPELEEELLPYIGTNAWGENNVIRLNWWGRSTTLNSL